MLTDSTVSLRDLVLAMSNLMDLVNPVFSNHHHQVAYIALSIARELGLPEDEINAIVIAASLHDTGALSVRERLHLLEFEVLDRHAHAERGYSLLKSFEPLRRSAEIIRYHHVWWEEREEFLSSRAAANGIPLGSHILHISDRAAVQIRAENKDILNQSEEIVRRVAAKSGSMFMPVLVEIFANLARKEYFWLDLVSPGARAELLTQVNPVSIGLSSDRFLKFADLFRRVIDFRSRFTATHSAGVAAVAESLARHVGFSDGECLQMKVAGFLHDLGKLAIPAEILDKPGKLTFEEINAMKSHTYHTYRTLEQITGFSTIAAWAAFHHERLDGTGYPFKLSAKDIPIGARIMAVADVFTALTEDRPYRKGQSPDQALSVVKKMALENHLDPLIVSTVENNFEELNLIRATAQVQSLSQFGSLPAFNQTG